MHLARIALAQGKGRVEIAAASLTLYDVIHYAQSGSLVRHVQLERIAGEDPDDTKARAVGAVEMLGYWPRLRRAMDEERRIAQAGKGEWPKLTPTVPIDAVELDNRAADAELRATAERITARFEGNRRGMIGHTDLGPV